MQKLTLKQIRKRKEEARNDALPSLRPKTIKETEGKGFDAERDAAQAGLDDLKKSSRIR